MIRVLFIFGTRPEAIKLAPVVSKFKEIPEQFEVRVCVTAQHREMLDQVLSVFEIVPEYDLDSMRPAQTLTQSTSRILLGLESVLSDFNPHLILVQGDTTTTLCGGLAGFYAGIPVGHVEAGLRTGDLRQPFPEELNRVLVSRMAELHFAATEGAAANLLSENVPEKAVWITGNSGIDAVLQVKQRLELGTLKGPEWPNVRPDKKMILVTAHRRESFGEGFERICGALLRLARRDDVELVYPVHPNPKVSGPVSERLGGLPNVHLLPPLEYVSFVDLMRRSYLILTDSGGIQEEGPSMGKPILVMREKTERPEAVEAGTATLVGSDVGRIVRCTSELLDDRGEYARRCRIHNPYGDGHASERIVNIVRDYFAVRDNSSAIGLGTAH